MRATIEGNNQRLELGPLGCADGLILKAIDISTPVNLYTAKGMLQNGETYINNTLAMTSIDVSIGIRGQSEDELYKLRQKIREVTNPALHGSYLYYKGKRIKVMLEELPVFTNNITGHYQDCILHFKGLDGYWEDANTQYITLGTWTPALHFPLQFNTDYKIPFGVMYNKYEANIINKGATRTGIIIVLSIRGIVNKPWLKNKTTGQTITINKLLMENEIFTINTKHGEKRVDMYSELQDDFNGYQYISDDSEFIELAPGDNKFIMGAERGVENLQISIEYNNQYMGV